jgi:hypothetical protein
MDCPKTKGGNKVAAMGCEAGRYFFCSIIVVTTL